MNTKLTFSLGWGLCFAGTMGGAVYGTMQGKDALAKQERENVILKAEMQRELARIASKREAEGRPSKLLSAARRSQEEDLARELSAPHTRAALPSLSE